MEFPLRNPTISDYNMLLMSNPLSDYNQFFYATMCHICKRFGDGVHLKRCGGCRMIAYCGKQHQKEHWKQHKPLCKAIQDVMPNHSLDDLVATMSSLGVPLMYWYKKIHFAVAVSNKLGRQLRNDEIQMIHCRRECLVCYEQNAESLEDCQKCAASLCKNHKDGIEHKDICASLELCLCLDLLGMRGKIGLLDMRNSYLKHVSYNCTFQNMKDFINAFGDIQTDSEMSYNIQAAQHSHFLTRPLTLFHAMRLLNYVPKRKHLVIHVVGANDVEIDTSMAWEVLPRLIETVMSVTIIMIGPKLICQKNLLHNCDKCKLRKKKCLMFEFHNVLYENYVRSPLFVKPDLVVGFNLGIYVRELGSEDETWAASIQVLAKQNCPFIITCLMKLEFQKEIDRINTILRREVNYLYGCKNPFASLNPFRNIGPEYISHMNQYVIIYRSLCS